MYCNSHTIDVTVYDFCHVMPCQNGGECTNLLRGYMCVCTKDYFGSKCDSEYYFMMDIKTILAHSTNFNSNDYVNGGE